MTGPVFNSREETTLAEGLRFHRLTLAYLIRPKKPRPTKRCTYECGLETIGEMWGQFRVQYYTCALISVIFDIETVFLYPWAVAYNRLELFAFIEMLILPAILLGGVFYVWHNGVLEWV